MRRRGRRGDDGGERRRTASVGVTSAVMVAALGIVVGLLSGPVSEDLPAVLGPWIEPAFFASIGLLLLTVALQTWRARADPASRRLRSEARRLAEKQQMIALVEAAMQRALEATFVDVPRMVLKGRVRMDLVRPVSPLPDGPVTSRRTETDVGDIGAVFERNGRSLLVLGAGGSGKSTLLAELCLHLCQVGEAGGTHPRIPVLVNLASWDDQPSLQEWLCRAIADTYLGVGQGPVSEWIEDRALVLVLDGLDEIPTVAGRQRALKAIDAFLRDGPCPIVVGSRTQEYAACGTRLGLAYAVELLTPNRREAQDYLTRLASPAAEAVARVPQSDRAWWDLVSTPMMLGVIARVSAVRPDADLVSGGSAKRRRRRIIAVYVDTLLHRRPDRPPHYRPEDALRWLEWLAEWMSRHAGSAFCPDRLTPAWIADVTDVAEIKGRPRYWLAMTWTAATTVWWIALLVPGNQTLSAVWLIKDGVLVTLTTSWHIRTRHCSAMLPIQPVWTVGGPWLRWSVLALTSTSVGVVLAAPESGGGSGNIPLWIAGACLVSAPVLIASVGSPVSIPDQAGLPPGARVTRSRRTAWNAALALGLPIALAAGVIRGLSNNDMGAGLVFAATFAVICMASCWLIFGGVPVLQYRALFRRLAAQGRGPDNYLAFLEWSRERLLLHTIGSAYRFPHREIMQHLARSWHQNR
jgi:hypothetical protein